MEKKQYENLRCRAKNILEKRKKSFPLDPDIYKIIEELNIYQIELEIQNEDLIKTQLELQTSQSKYADLYHLAPISYFTCNLDGLIMDVNQAGAELLGIKKHRLINRCFSTYILPEYQFLFAQHRKIALIDNIVQTCELKLSRWSEPALHIQLNCKSIQEVNADHKQLLICVIDISNRKYIEKMIQLQRIKTSAIDKIQCMSEQVCSISDNQNYSLTIIDNYLHGCIRRMESEKYNLVEIVEILKKMALQLEVLSKNMAEIRNLTSKSILRYESININKLLSDTILLVQQEILEFPVSICYKFENNLPILKLDILHIQQALLNLARNSIEAMRDAETNDPKLHIELSLLNKDTIEISILDNGPGFNTNIAENMFNSNFTTKNYAVGLGLSVSRKIIEKHGGQLTAHLNASGGACFQVLLPCTEMIN